MAQFKGIEILMLHAIHPILKIIRMLIVCRSYWLIGGLTASFIFLFFGYGTSKIEGSRLWRRGETGVKGRGGGGGVVGLQFR